jgi:hypothetical protein
VLCQYTQLCERPAFICLCGMCYCLSSGIYFHGPAIAASKAATGTVRQCFVLVMIVIEGNELSIVPQAALPHMLNKNKLTNMCCCCCCLTTHMCRPLVYVMQFNRHASCLVESSEKHAP